jgi:hypothetical protein
MSPPERHGSRSGPSGSLDGYRTAPPESTAVTTADTLRAQQLAFAASAADQADAGALLAGDPHGGPPRLGVYRHAYRARLTEALADNFEILARAMGDAPFTALADAYITAHPSTHPSIRWFGHRLADFMAGSVDADAGLVPHPAFVDLARMDWALRAAFDAADAPAVGREALAGCAPQDFAALRPAAHPSVQQLRLDWAVEAAWRTLREHDPDSGTEPALPAPEEQPHTLLVWRRGLETVWRSVEPVEATLLQGLAAGESFGELCERAAAIDDDVMDAAQRAASALAQWLDDGLISRIA